MERSDNATTTCPPTANLNPKYQRMQRHREHKFDLFVQAFLGDRDNVSSFSNKLILSCIKIVLRALRDGLIAPRVYAKAGYCLSLMAHTHSKAAKAIVTNGGIVAILQLIKAFPTHEKLQMSLLGTLTVISMQLKDDKHKRGAPFAGVVQRAAATLEQLPGSSRAYEAACLFLSSMYPTINLNIFEYESLVGNVLRGLEVHGHDDMAHFAGCRVIECLFSESDPTLARRIVQDAERKQNPGAAA